MLQTWIFNFAGNPELFAQIQQNMRFPENDDKKKQFKSFIYLTQVRQLPPFPSTLNKANLFLSKWGKHTNTTKLKNLRVILV